MSHAQVEVDDGDVGDEEHENDEMDSEDEEEDEEVGLRYQIRYVAGIVCARQVGRQSFTCQAWCM